MTTRRNDHWTAGDCETLLALVASGKAEKEIATAMGRTQKAINIQKSKLKITHDAPLYRITSPSGEVFSAANLNEFCEARTPFDAEFTLPVRKSKASMGLQWALRKGRTWKGWAVLKIEAGTRIR